MYWVYVLEASDSGWYIGFTSNLKRRITEHNSGKGARTTKRKDDWKVIYCEGYTNKADAMGRERFLKSGAGRGFLKKQLSHYLEK